MNKKTLTPMILVGIFFLMLGLSFAAVPLYDLFCRVTGFGGTTQNAENKEIPKIVINKDYKIRFDTNSNGALDWKFYPEKNTISLKPGEVHTVKFFVENESNQPTSGSATFNVSPSPFGIYLNKIGCFCFFCPGCFCFFVGVAGPPPVQQPPTTKAEKPVLAFIFCVSPTPKKSKHINISNK